MDLILLLRIIGADYITILVDLHGLTRVALPLLLECQSLEQIEQKLSHLV